MPGLPASAPITPSPQRRAPVGALTPRIPRQTASNRLHIRVSIQASPRRTPTPAPFRPAAGAAGHQLIGRPGWARCGVPQRSILHPGTRPEPPPCNPSAAPLGAGHRPHIRGPHPAPHEAAGGGISRERFLHPLRSPRCGQRPQHRSAARSFLPTYTLRELQQAGRSSYRT